MARGIFFIWRRPLVEPVTGWPTPVRGSTGWSNDKVQRRARTPPEKLEVWDPDSNPDLQNDQPRRYPADHYTDSRVFVGTSTTTDTGNTRKILPPVGRFIANFISTEF